MFTTLERHEYFVVGSGELLQKSLAETRYNYRKMYRNQPTELWAGGEALHSLLGELNEKYIPVDISGYSVQGLHIKQDPNLPTNGWMVGYTREVIRKEQ